MRMLAFALPLVLAAALPPPALAQLVAIDNFETYPANGPLGGQNGGTGWTAPWATNTGADTTATVVSQALRYVTGNLELIGGGQALRVDAINTFTGTVDAFASRTFADQTGAVYFSYLFQPGPSIVSADRNAFFQTGLDIAPQNPRASVGLAAPTGATAGPQQFYARASTASGTAPAGPTVFTGTTVTEPVTFLVVGKISMTVGGNYDRVDLYVNPTSTTEPGIPSATSTADSTLANLSLFDIRLARLQAGDFYLFDDLRVGTTFASVAPLTPVPEPTGVLAVTLATAAAGYVWRRRAVTSR
jgi:hypothetical protein